MLIENMEIVYKDGQGNIYIIMSLVEYKLVKIILYLNIKQFLKFGVIIIKVSKSCLNIISKMDKKDDKKKMFVKKKVEDKKKSVVVVKDVVDNVMGVFDYIGCKNKIVVVNNKVYYI